MNLLANYPLLAFYAAKPGWQWRIRQGMLVFPHKMSTYHLHNAMRRVYNVVVTKHSVMGAFYTKKYLLDALFELGHELVFREDTNSAMLSDLTKVQNYLEAGSVNERSASITG